MGESNVFKFFDSILVHQFIIGDRVQKHQDCINKGIFQDSRRPIVVFRRTRRYALFQVFSL